MAKKKILAMAVASVLIFETVLFILLFEKVICSILSVIGTLLIFYFSWAQYNGRPPFFGRGSGDSGQSRLNGAGGICDDLISASGTMGIDSQQLLWLTKDNAKPFEQIVNAFI